MSSRHTWVTFSSQAIEAGCWFLGILGITLAASLLIKFILLVVRTW